MIRIPTGCTVDSGSFYFRRYFQQWPDERRLVLVERPGIENCLAVVAHGSDVSDLGHEEFKQTVQPDWPRKPFQSALLEASSDSKYESWLYAVFQISTAAISPG